MSLVDLKTDLKSLKFGNDRPGGGDSKQPYIVTDINNPTTPINLRSSIPIINQIAKMDDGLVRGGVIGALNASATDTLRISKFLYTDVKGYLFITKQVGLQLSNPLLETKKLNIGGGPFLNFVGNVVNAVRKEIGPTRVYNLLGSKTLAQVPINAFGGHIVRHGLAAVDPDQYYINVVTENNFINNTDRLTLLKGKFNLGNLQPTIPVVTNRTQRVLRTAFRVLGSIASAANQISSIFGGPRIPFLPNKLLTPDELVISQYIGGPDSVYGIGSTTIRRYDNTSNPNVKNGFNLLQHGNQQAGRTRDSSGGPTPVNYVVGLGVTKQLVNDGYIQNIDDAVGFQSKFDYLDLATYGNLTKGNIDYSSGSISTYNSSNVLAGPTIFNPGVPIRNASYAAYKAIINNQILTQNPRYVNGIYANQFGVYTGVNTNGDTYLNRSFDTDEVNPISKTYPIYTNGQSVVKINIPWDEVYREKRIGSGKQDSINLTPLFSSLAHSNYNTVTLNNGQTYTVRDLAKFIIQSVDTDAPSQSTFMVFRAYITNLSDNVDANWTDVKYAGRGNPFYIYNGFTRKIQIGFKVAALSKEEMAPMYSKLNYLMSSLMPDYGDKNVMRGPLHRLTVGNYLDAQLGILNSISYTVPNDSPWEIAIDEPEGGTKQLILPHVIEVSMNFTPIGAETGWFDAEGKGVVNNKIEEKSEYVSFLAQNTTGNDVATTQYYDAFLNPDSILTVESSS